MKKRISGKKYREIMLKNAKFLLSEEFKAPSHEILGEKRKKRNKFLRSISQYDIIKTLVKYVI